MNGYIKALNAGSEVVIISKNTNDDSCIFWKTCGTYYSFNRSFHVLERTDMTDDRFLAHIQKMGQEGAQFFIRGRND